MFDFSKDKPEQGKAEPPKPEVVQRIEQLLGITLYAAPTHGYDPVSNVVRGRLDRNSEEECWLCQYGLHEDGTLAGLNLMASGLTDAKWTTITELDINWSRIEALNLSRNQLTALPQLKQMTALRYVDLTDNQLQEVHLPPTVEHVFLWGNPNISTPPPEIIKQGRFAILQFFKELAEQGEEVVYEAKLLILGDAGAGKTTLARRLENTNAPMPDAVKDSTDGIAVKTLELTGQNPTFIAHIWDFGGQEVYHATHQFFLTKRSLYLLLCDGRKEEQFDYWLQAQELFGEDSLLLVVVNQKGEMQVNLPMSDLRRDYPNIRDAQPTVVNLKDDTAGIIALRKHIEHTIRNLPQFVRGERVPRKWAAIRRRLEQLQDDHIELKQFRSICAEEGIEERERQDFLLDFLHNLGILLYFRDLAGLNKMVILKPEWATKAVYRVLDHTKAKGNKGHFTRRDLLQVWNCAEYADYFEELLLLMDKFELCYETPERTDVFVVPSLLPDDSPEGYIWAEPKGLQIHYAYTFMPKGIMARLIVRQHRLLESEPQVWKRGAVFAQDQVRAEVIESYRDKRITLRVNASNRTAKELLRDLCRDIDDLNADFHFNERLTVEQEVPCNCHICATLQQPKYFKRSELDKAERAGKPVYCTESFELISVQAIRDGIFPMDKIGGDMLVKNTPEGGIKAFFSYSKHDIAHLKDFQKFLKPLERQGLIEFWDDRLIRPGEEWDGEIKEALAQSDIIFLMVTADFINTDYVWEIEIKEAMRRHDAKTARVVPIKVSSCDWTGMPFAKLQGIPRKDQVIDLAPNKAAVWTEVVNEIKEILITR
jgi:internalin A